MGLLSLTYKRPSYVSDHDFRLSQSSFGEKEKASLRSGEAGVKGGIPSALTFEKVMSGMTCPVRVKVHRVQDSSLTIPANESLGLHEVPPLH